MSSPNQGELSTMSTLMDNAQNAKVLLGILAQVNRCMMIMRTNLDGRPEVRTANRTCDVLDYHDPMDPEDKFWDFEAYVEVETSTGELLCWSLELRAKAETWEVYRRISVAQENGGETVTDFPDISFESFELFTLGVLPLVDEFAESTKDFDFSSRRLANK
jgi:hypothetical protein